MQDAQFTPDFSPESLTVSASGGMLSGKSHEMVYDEVTGRKISQLDWKLKNVAILKGDISWDAYSFLTLNARGWTSMASGSGHMDDYDWLNDKQSAWTDHSSHPATHVNYANEYDLNVKGWIFQGENYKAGVTAGYQKRVSAGPLPVVLTITITGQISGISRPVNVVLVIASVSLCHTLALLASIVLMTLNLTRCLNSVIGSVLMITTSTICAT